MLLPNKIKLIHAFGYFSFQKVKAPLVKGALVYSLDIKLESHSNLESISLSVTLLGISI